MYPYMWQLRESIAYYKSPSSDVEVLKKPSTHVVAEAPCIVLVLIQMDDTRVAGQQIKVWYAAKQVG